MNSQIPFRFYEPNILRNPFEWMGIWTPHGWRSHRKRFGKAERLQVNLPIRSGQTFFPGALCHVGSGNLAWNDDLHLRDDPFTDGGIYPCDPRVEFPVGNPRWSVSHSLLCHPVADHSLHTHEYTWDMARGDLTVHFRHHVALEEARTDGRNGNTVTIRQAPISQAIEGNVAYDVPNSAVRGVWLNPEKSGPNLYARRAIQHLKMLNGTYVLTPHRPVLQCRGVWALLPGDPIGELFDPQTGQCRSVDSVIQATGIPLDEPKLAMFLPPITPRLSKLYEGELGMLAQHDVTIDARRVAEVERRIGVAFEQALAGYSGGNSAITSPGGYFPELDFNNNGIIDQDDLQTIRRHAGRTMRSNLYVHSYFGPDWLSICVALDEEQKPGKSVLADYDYGAGYDARAGTISLFETPGPGQPVWIEYYSDAPAIARDGEIRLTTYREMP